MGSEDTNKLFKNGNVKTKMGKVVDEKQKVPSNEIEFMFDKAKQKEDNKFEW